MKIPFLKNSETKKTHQPQSHFLNYLNWEKFSYKPEVSFQISHTNHLILLNYQVTEKYIRALETDINGDVYNDSCVEFFISFDGENYYNFEFNCIGTIHLAYGSERENRKLIDRQIIENIEIFPSLGKQAFEENKGNFKWELSVKIPLTCFVFDKIKNLSGKKAKANFYKCGDATSEPHYLSWKPIKTISPNFHQPNFFGEVEFE